MISAYDFGAILTIDEVRALHRYALWTAIDDARSEKDTVRRVQAREALGVLSRLRDVCSRYDERERLTDDRS